MDVPKIIPMSINHLMSDVPSGILNRNNTEPNIEQIMMASMPSISEENEQEIKQCEIKINDEKFLLAIFINLKKRENIKLLIHLKFF